MTVVAALLAVALVAVVYLLLRHQRQCEGAWEAERRELLNRVQRPEMIPVQPPSNFELPDLEPDDSALVGTIADPPEGETP